MAYASKEADHSKRWPSEIYDWHEEVSRIEIQSSEGDVIVFALDAYGMGIPDQTLAISIKHCPEGLDFGIDTGEMDKLAAWLLAAQYAVRALRGKKEKQARRLEKERRDMRYVAKTRAHLKATRKS